MNLILLSGKQGAGKTTLQKKIAEEWFSRDPYNVALDMNFADTLYKMHDAVLGVLHEYMPPRAIVKDGPLLQLLGTEWGRRTISETIWVDVMRARIDRVKSLGGLAPEKMLVIVGDCRFENEFDAFPEALRVRIECPREVRKARCSMWRENENHPSEIGLDAYADADKFDVYLRSVVLTPEKNAKLVLHLLGVRRGVVEV